MEHSSLIHKILFIKKTISGLQEHPLPP